MVFLGTPDMAVAPLDALVAAGFDVVLVVTGPDKRRGRGGVTSPTPVKAAAERLGLAVSHDPADAASVDADVGVVVAYGQILKRALLEAIPMVNLHFSLLPRWRGAAPVERAILAGDDRTGVCVMAVDEGLDTGGVYAIVEVPIDPSATADDLRAQLTDAGARLLVETLRRGLDDPAPQEGEPTYAHKLATEDLRLDWARPAEELHRVVRVGGAWTTIAGRRLKVVEAEPVAVPDDGSSPAPGALRGDAVATGSGWLRLRRVQPEGRTVSDATAWLGGARLASDERLGAS